MDRIDLGPCGAFLSERGERTAILLPGANGGALQASFAFLRELFVGRGWSVLAVHDEYRGGDGPAWARERAAAAFAFREPALVVGKSMASYAAALVEAPAVWLTPLLREPGVREAIRPPALLVGGTADPLWDSAAAHALGVEVLELDGVNHGLVREGDAYRSLEAMRRLLDAVAAFAL